jgi:hypothetical protein
MNANRRRAERYAFSGLGRIQQRAGALPRDCLVTDVSDGGVRLHAEGVDVPDNFILLFGRDGHTKRECRVIWRLGHEVGAEFVDADQQGFPRRLAS